jgi:hypothetical protein
LTDFTPDIDIKSYDRINNVDEDESNNSENSFIVDIKVVNSK